MKEFGRSKWINLTVWNIIFQFQFGAQQMLAFPLHSLPTVVVGIIRLAAHLRSVSVLPPFAQRYVHSSQIHVALCFQIKAVPRAPIRRSPFIGSTVTVV